MLGHDACLPTLRSVAEAFIDTGRPPTGVIRFSESGHTAAAHCGPPLGTQPLTPPMFAMPNQINTAAIDLLDARLLVPGLESRR
nr:hypothetical protein GCM10017745_68080 [Saccharothrix mutabilis subsp. capreolus]